MVAENAPAKTPLRFATSTTKAPSDGIMAQSLALVNPAGFHKLSPLPSSNLSSTSDIVVFCFLVLFFVSFYPSKTIVLFGDD